MGRQCVGPTVSLFLTREEIEFFTPEERRAVFGGPMGGQRERPTRLSRFGKGGLCVYGA
jgi:hypothetical protein